MRSIIKAAASHPWQVILLLGLLSLLAATQLPSLRVSVSAEGMLEKGTPAWDFLLRTEQTFGSADLVVVVVRDPDLFDSSKLADLKGLELALAELPGILSTSSLFNARNIRDVDGEIHTDPYLGELPQTAQQAERVVQQARLNPLVVGNLMSDDGNTLAINLSYRSDPADAAFQRRLAEGIEALIAPLRDRFERVYQVGSLVIRSDLDQRMRADQQVFLPLSVLVLLLILLVALRRLNAALLPLLTASISVLWTLGFMAWLGIPVNIMTSIVPALVIIIGSTEDIHLLSEYSAGVRDGLARRAAVDRMGDRMGMAVLLTFVTTYLGFLSIALNNIELLRQFGVVASSGLLFNFVITVLLVPVVLAWRGHTDAGVAGEARQASWFERRVVALVVSAQHHRGTILIAAALIAILAMAGASQLRINNNLLEYLEPGSPLRTDIEQVHRDLAGVHTFSIVVESGIDNTFLQAKYLEQLVRIQNHLAQSPDFDRSFSLADVLMVIDRAMMGEPDAELMLPESDDVVREYMLSVDHEDVSNFVSEDFAQARILVRHNVSDSAEFNRAIAQLHEFVNGQLASGLRVGITGRSVLSDQAVERMAYGQLYSLLFVGGAILLLVSMLFVSIRAGLVALVPNLFPVAILFAVMAASGIPLNVGTSMVAAIALGICVDDTMHAMSRFHEELKRQPSREQALIAMVRAEATPIMATSIALSAGFAVFATSSFAPVSHFGLLSAMVILVALLATFVITPLLLSTTKLLTVWDLLSYKIQEDALKKSELFTGMYVWQIKKLLLASEVRHFEKGELLIREGDVGEEMFVVLEGRVEARRLQEDGSSKQFRELGPGGLCGEAGPLARKARTADVVALVDTQALVLSWDRIDRLVQHYPLLAFRLFRNLTRIVCVRLAQTTEYRTQSPHRGTVVSGRWPQK